MEAKIHFYKRMIQDVNNQPPPRDSTYFEAYLDLQMLLINDMNSLQNILIYKYKIIEKETLSYNENIKYYDTNTILEIYLIMYDKMMGEDYKVFYNYSDYYKTYKVPSIIQIEKMINNIDYDCLIFCANGDDYDSISYRATRVCIS